MTRQNLLSLNANLYGFNWNGLANDSVDVALASALSLERNDVRGLGFVFSNDIPLSDWYSGPYPKILEICSQTCPDNYWTRSCMRFMSPNVRGLASECLLAAEL
jgi:hypothetical protein